MRKTALRVKTQSTVFRHDNYNSLCENESAFRSLADGAEVNQQVVVSPRFTAKLIFFTPEQRVSSVSTNEIACSPENRVA